MELFHACFDTRNYKEQLYPFLLFYWKDESEINLVTDYSSFCTREQSLEACSLTVSLMGEARMWVVVSFPHDLIPRLKHLHPRLLLWHTCLAVSCATV
jgi:hypothetical protein